MTIENNMCYMYGTDKINDVDLRASTMLVKLPQHTRDKIRRCVHKVVEEAGLTEWHNEHSYYETGDALASVVVQAYFAYYILLKSKPGWPMDFIILASKMGCYKRTTLRNADTHFVDTRPEDGVIPTHCIISALLHFFNADKHWELHTILRENKSTSPHANRNCLTGEYKLTRRK